jgi:GT2 family glycosyltransferase
MEAALARYPNSIAFNPRLLNEDGSQFLRRRTILQPRPYLIRPPLPTGDESVIMATGAALWMRKKDFEHLGGFDEKIFLYYEDDDLSARIVKSGRTIHYVHDAVVYHRGRSSSGPSEETNAFRDYEAMKSRIYVSRKHGVLFVRWWHIWRNRLRRISVRSRNRQGKLREIDAKLKALREGP